MIETNSSVAQALTPSQAQRIAWRQARAVAVLVQRAAVAATKRKIQAEGRRKLESKGCDMIVANLVGGANSPFESEHNEVTLLLANGDTTALPRLGKREVADRIFDEALKLRLALHSYER